MNEEKALEKIETIIKKSRIHFYKPFQIAEILYQIRNGNKNVAPENVETYRIQSKKWRDSVSIRLTGNVCSSSSKFQDDLFNEDACPPYVLKTLSDINIKNNGSVESFIYKSFQEKTNQMNSAINYINSNHENFSISDFLDLFTKESGLKRSLDKVFEIVVYSIFQSLVDEFNVTNEISINCSNETFNDFSSFSNKVLSLNHINDKKKTKGSFFRAGVANAADRGLDIYSNFGKTVQIKHINLNEKVAKDVVDSISSDSIIIVCKEAEKNIIENIVYQLGWGNRIQSIITIDEIYSWYDKCKKNKHLFENVLMNLKEQIHLEFPSTEELNNFIKERNY